MRMYASIERAHVTHVLKWDGCVYLLVCLCCTPACEHGCKFCAHSNTCLTDIRIYVHRYSPLPTLAAAWHRHRHPPIRTPHHKLTSSFITRRGDTHIHVCACECTTQRALIYNYCTYVWACFPLYFCTPSIMTCLHPNPLKVVPFQWLVHIYEYYTLVCVPYKTI